jgi:cyclic-di-AMP phosphodiesterase PgpH
VAGKGSDGATATATATVPFARRGPDAAGPGVVMRAAAALVLVAVMTLATAAGSLGAGAGPGAGEPASTTVFATEPLRIVDDAATERARRAAVESVGAVRVPDPDAQAAIVTDVRTVLATVRDVRGVIGPDGEAIDAAPGSDPDAVAPEAEPARLPTPQEQAAALARAVPSLAPDVIAALVALTDVELDVVERETIAIAQLLARQRFGQDQAQAVLDDVVAVELGLRALPVGAGERVVLPLLARALRPTIVIDAAATDEARQRAAAAVPEVARVWQPGEVVVRQGEVVGALEAAAIVALGLGGADPVRDAWRGLLAGLVTVGIGAILLARQFPSVRASTRRLWLLVLLIASFAGTAALVDGIARSLSSAWAFAVPAASLAMLTALLLGRGPALATVLPAVAVVLALDPGAAAVALHAAAMIVLAVPLTGDITTRSDLRVATLRVATASPLVAAIASGITGGAGDLPVALVAGTLGGVVAAVAVLGLLPFLESAFRLPTVTALLDLADRNHPLLRRLEAEAIGTYNHAVMVAALTERACRAIGADPLLGSVAALYHDVGKVRRPHFFIENQLGIGNPHDGLAPADSARVIQQHVDDGVALAVEHRFPPEVVECIASHHGTMRVAYFHDAAMREAHGDLRSGPVDEDAFRYPGRRPSSREAAVLMLADGSEAATRAAAMSRGTLPRDEIAATVSGLLEARLADGQFDDARVTLRELGVVRDTIVDALVGIYHPRIAYPGAAGGVPAAGPGDAGPGERDRTASD